MMSENATNSVKRSKFIVLVQDLSVFDIDFPETVNKKNFVNHSGHTILRVKGV